MQFGWITYLHVKGKTVNLLDKIGWKYIYGFEFNKCLLNLIVLISNCCCKNYHKHRGLKQHRHILMKLSKIKYKEKILKAAREKQIHTRDSA